MWLLNKGKTEKARRTLGKLRGWVSHDTCAHEFQEMVVFTSSNEKQSKSIGNTAPTVIVYNPTFYSFIGDASDNLESSWLQLFKPDVLKPFRLILVYFFFANILSGVPYGPYLVQVFNTFGADVDVEWTIVRIRAPVVRTVPTASISRYYEHA